MPVGVESRKKKVLRFLKEISIDILWKIIKIIFKKDKEN